MSEIRTLEWKGGVRGHLALLDQTLLPNRVRYVRIRQLSEIIAAIRRLVVRGAPAIGCAAAYGMVLGLRGSRARTRGSFLKQVERVRKRLAASRPTAVNLFWAVDRMSARAASLDFEEVGRDAVLERLLQEARAIHLEDRKLCRKIGEHGARLLRNGWNVLTHCNAGALATGGSGTALAVVYHAVRSGKKVKVFADETRPLLQGARLTSWELEQAGVDVTLICDNAAASVMQEGEVDCVVVGADRIARNGDVANKIGTYGLAVLARQHGVPFYVAAPTTTLDPATPTGKDIPIENRDGAEVTDGFGQRTAPRNVGVYNPAFDVTPSRLVTGIITELGVIRPPYRRSIAALLKKLGRTGSPR